MPNASSTAPGPDPGRFARGVAGLDRAAWNRANRGANPFSDHRFLAALEDSGCVGPGTGWTPRPLVQVSDSGLLAVPAYVKDHSHGEFVFDWTWAHASERAGMRWYPKLLVASPFTPVTGPRLLGADSDPAATGRLAARLRAETDALGLSSAGINFCDPVDAPILEHDGWLARRDWQYHWHNPGFRDFEDFLGTLKRKPRKNIRRERRLAHDAGWTFKWLDGTELDAAAIELVWRCYRTTFMLYANRPALNLDFFGRQAAEFGAQFLVCLALRHGRARACAVYWRDAERLYGRYWGSLEATRDVHFEACYYQGIEYCIEHRLKAFEPGAQGEHKIRRGFLPVATRSYHYIRHRQLRDGVRRWLALENNALDEYRVQLETLNPFAEIDPRPDHARPDSPPA